MFSYFDKLYKKNKQYALVGYDSWVDCFIECYQNVSLKEKKWNETWDMRITQAESSLKICPDSCTYLGGCRGRSEAPNMGEGTWLKVAGEMGQTYGLQWWLILSIIPVLISVFNFFLSTGCLTSFYNYAKVFHSDLVIKFFHSAASSN